MQRICIIRALRLDRVLFCASRFVRLNLGPQFADPPPFDLRAIYQSSNHRTPLIFVLSPGVDPTAQVKSLANDLSTNVDICALGQGQAPVAMSLMNLGLRSGSWVFLANWCVDLCCSYLEFALNFVVVTLCSVGCLSWKNESLSTAR